MVNQQEELINKEAAKMRGLARSIRKFATKIANLADQWIEQAYYSQKTGDLYTLNAFSEEMAGVEEQLEVIWDNAKMSINQPRY